MGKKQVLMLLCALILSLTLTSAAFAHELWFELQPTGEVGKEHTVDLIWGHFPGTVDQGSSYFEQMAGGELKLLTPQGELVELEMTKLADRYQAKFVPEVGGDYQVIFFHDRGVLDWQHGEPTGVQAITTISKAYIDVHGDQETAVWDQVAGLDLDIKAISDVGHLHVNDEMESQLLYQGQPLAGANVTVLSPTEELLELTTDDQGKFKFTPSEPGLWLVKVAHFDDSVSSVAGEDVLGARYSLTMLLQPHGHGSAPDHDHDHDHDHDAEHSGAAADSTGSKTAVSMYVLAAILILGAGYMLLRKK